jgi:lipoprotein-anchoring transpeptidase ErfK/SrfK
MVVELRRARIVGSTTRIVLVTALLVAAACGGSEEPAAAPHRRSDAAPASPTTGAEDALPAEASLVAQAVVPQVEVFAAADPAPGDVPATVLANPNENGAPLVFLLTGREADDEWLSVYLPVRPNGSTGFVRADQVTVARDDYRIEIALGAHHLTVTKLGEPVLESGIAVGTAETPTPGGVYYVKELLQPPDPNGAYGPYAYGLSGFSNQLDSFNGGDGVIGIHGTSDPSSIGRDVSHGCIRVPNDVVTQMAGMVPLGTPVEITP